MIFIHLSISLCLPKMLPKNTKRYKRKYIGWLQGENRKSHKISRDKNLTESVHRKISHGVRNSLATSYGFAGCTKFHTVCKICPSLNPAATPLNFCMLCENFAYHAKMLVVGFLPLIFFLASMIGLATYCQAWQRAMKCSKAWILHVFELQLALPWIWATKNTKTCQKLISNPC